MEPVPAVKVGTIWQSLAAQPIETEYWWVASTSGDHWMEETHFLSYRIGYIRLLWVTLMPIFILLILLVQLYIAEAMAVFLGPSTAAARGRTFPKALK